MTLLGFFRASGTLIGGHAMPTLEQRARRFAREAHGKRDQRRKYTQEPYIIHPAAVVEWVRQVPHNEAMLAAAWLHDTVEDTGVSLGQIQQRFGVEVAELVAMLTLPAFPGPTSRVVKQQAALRHLANACDEAKTIKLADIIDNTCSLIRYDADFASVYLVEKKLQLEVLSGGDSRLWREAERTLDKGLQTLRQPPHLISEEWFKQLTVSYQGGARRLSGG
ncbi:Metal dependent phosphohydrolase [Sodalis praecaptivus]|uniref:Metal dependent phosphohydrolase n=2 Tax=Bruguierivoracaceae TaxID=2812006 RepID=W0HSP0_9GAMM|nr:Metal dependent phosphohydrolase [Sodalis praecaptivus]